MVVGYDAIAAKNYSLSAGQYFDIKIQYVDLTPVEFAAKIQDHRNSLEGLFRESAELEQKIHGNLLRLSYE